MTDDTLGIALAVAALCMFATNVVMTRYAMARLRLDVGFLIAVSVNVAFAFVAFAVELWLRRSPLGFDLPGFFLFVLAGAFTTYLGRYFFFETVARLGPARASTFQISSPMFTALIAWLFLGERLSIAVVVSMLVVIFGLYLAGQSTRKAAEPLRDANKQRRKVHAVGEFATSLVPTGLLLGVGSAMAYALGNVVRGAAIHRWREPILGALLGAVCGVILHVISSRATRSVIASIRTANRAGVALYAAGGVLTISAQILTIASMSYIPVSVAALITLCTPLIVIPVSHWLFRSEDPVTMRVVAGSALALAGIAVIVLR